MDPGNERGRSSTDRPATYTIGSATVSRSCRDRKSYEAGFLDGWRDRAEYGRRSHLTFDDGVEAGFMAGVRAADRAMRNAIADATHGMPANAAEVVRQLVAGWDVLNWRAEADRSGRRPGDYPGREAA